MDVTDDRSKVRCCKEQYCNGMWNVRSIPFLSFTEEAEVEWFYEDLQDLLELTPKKDVFFIIGDWNTKVGNQETPGEHILSGFNYSL